MTGRRPSCFMPMLTDRRQAGMSFTAGTARWVGLLLRGLRRRLLERAASMCITLGSGAAEVALRVTGAGLTGTLNGVVLQDAGTGVVGEEEVMVGAGELDVACGG